MLDRSRIIARRLSALALAPLLAAGGVFAGPGTPVAKLILVPQAYMAPAVHLAKLRADQPAACKNDTIKPYGVNRNGPEKAEGDWPLPLWSSAISRSPSRLGSLVWPPSWLRSALSRHRLYA